MMIKRWLLLVMLVVGVAVITQAFRGQDDPLGSGPAVMKQPSTYKRGSERYYLAWVDHGTPGRAGMAAMRLLRMPGKKEVVLTQQVRARQREVMRDILLLVLFDIDSGSYWDRVYRLSGASCPSGFGWIKTDEMFEGDFCDFYFQDRTRRASP